MTDDTHDRAVRDFEEVRRTADSALNAMAEGDSPTAVKELYKIRDLAGQWEEGD